jgi:hypothetical protein
MTGQKGRSGRPKGFSPGRKRGRSCYVGSGGKCGHPECLEANREYQRLWVRRKRGGIDYFEDITDVG